MRLSFTTLGCPDWTLRQIVEGAARWGYDGVDFRGLLDEIDITRRPEFTTDLDGTKQLFADQGIAISGLLISARYAVADAAETQTQFADTRRHLDLAAELGVPFLRVYGGRVPEGHTPESIMPFMVQNLRQMGDEARDHSVLLALETHDDWTDSALCARLMAQVDHPHVRILWDLHHPYRMNHEEPEFTYRNLAPYTANVHVKDSLADEEGTPTYVPVGEGDVPLKRLLDLLAAGGYEGYACLEWEKRWHPELPGPEVVFPHYMRQMREWLG